MSAVPRSEPGLRGAMFSATDYWRRLPAAPGGRAGYKEWSYFCVFGPELDLLINFSLMDNGSPGRANAGQPELPRLVVLAQEKHDRWEGDVEEFAAESALVPPGGCNARFGANSLLYDGALYRIELEMNRRPVRAELALTPMTLPAIASSVRLSKAGPMRWLVVPRLLASGTVEIAGRRHTLQDCPAYHDRNWGHFSWGADFSWEWAVILPEEHSEPWTLVYMRIGDRNRARTFSQGLIVWHRDTPWRTFHGGDLDVCLRGLLESRAPFRVPKVTHLAVPGTASDVPRSLRVTGRLDADTVECAIDFSGLAQIGVPNDTPRGITMLSETGGRARVRGRIRGENLDFDGRVLAEFNHAA